MSGNGDTFTIPDYKFIEIIELCLAFHAGNRKVTFT
jgi:hypothetical protein